MNSRKFNPMVFVILNTLILLIKKLEYELVNGSTEDRVVDEENMEVNAIQSAEGEED